MATEATSFPEHGGFAAHRHVGSSLLYERASGAPATITIAIPTYKRPHLLKEAINSAASQSGADAIELLIVDNDETSSDTGIVDYLMQLPLGRVRYYRNAANTGMFGNWNRCIALCQTEWLTILNDDDRLHPAFVETMNEALARLPHATMLACRSYVVDERPPVKGRRRRWNLISRLRSLRAAAGVSKLQAIDYFIKNRHYGSLGILFSRQAAIESGGFAPEFHPSSDYEFFSSLSSRKGSYMLQRPLTEYRIAVNESLRLETVLGWKAKDSVIRRNLGTRLAGPAALKDLYVRLAADIEFHARVLESGLGGSRYTRAALLMDKLLCATCAATLRLLNRRALP